MGDTIMLIEYHAKDNGEAKGTVNPGIGMKAVIVKQYLMIVFVAQFAFVLSLWYVRASTIMHLGGTTAINWSTYIN